MSIEIEQLGYNGMENEVIRRLAMNNVRKASSRFMRASELYSDSPPRVRPESQSLQERFIAEFDENLRNSTIIVYYANKDYQNLFTDDITWVCENDESCFGHLSEIDRVFVVCASWVSRNMGIASVLLNRRRR